MIGDFVFVHQTVDIDIQLLRNSVRLDVNSKMLAQLRRRSAPLWIVGSYSFGNPFKQWLGRSFPKLGFDFIKLPHQRFRVLLQIHTLVLLISSRHFKRGVIVRALIL